MPNTKTLIEQLEDSGVKVDVDSYHLSWIKAVPFKPHDVTSNQIVLQQQMMLPENKEIIEQTIKEMKDKDWLDIHTVLVRYPFTGAYYTKKADPWVCRQPGLLNGSYPSSRAECSLKSAPGSGMTKRPSRSIAAHTRKPLTQRVSPSMSMSYPAG